MKPTLKSLLVTVVSVNPAYAATNQTETVSWLGWLFTGFAALIITFQLVPAIILFAAMLNGMLSAGTKSLQIVVVKK